MLNFYKQNSYLEFDALLRFGISDYKTFLKKQLPQEKLLFLDSCVVSGILLERAEADIEECIRSKSYLDLQSNLPSVFNETDLKLLADTVLKGQISRETVQIDSYVLSKAFLDDLSKDCEEIVDLKAKEIVENGKYQQYQTDLQIGTSKGHRVEELEEVKGDKREERRKKASGGKSGGGTQVCFKCTLQFLY